MSTLRTLALAGLGWFAASCGRSSAAPPSDDPPPAPEHRAAAAADDLDKRTPLPMTAMMAEHQKREMRDHLRVVQEVVAALATDDFDAIETATARIAWSEQQAMMCEHMGAGAPGFAEIGESFHRTADGIIAAARRRDRAAVASALDATLQTCVGCHETYRQQIVSDSGAHAGPAMTGSETPEDCPMHGK